MAFNFFLLFLGLSVGSFLNVVIDRLAANKTLFGRSHCDHCRRPLGAIHLIPIVSFLLLGGRSGCCRKPISWYYPITEALTGAAFVLGFRFFDSPDLGLKFTMLGVLACLIVIFFADLKYQIIPDEILIVLAVLAFPFALADVKNHLLAGAILFGVFYLMHLAASGRAMGFGDVKFVLVIGWLQGLPMALLSVYFGFILGGAAGVFLLILGRAKRKSQIPFGPFLVLGMAATIFFEKAISAMLINFGLFDLLPMIKTSLSGLQL